jgi:FHA domain
MLSPPSVRLNTDHDLSVGEFGIATRMVQRPRRTGSVEAPEARPELGATMVYRPKPEAADAEAEEPPPVQREVVTLTVGDKSHEIEKRTVLVGRSQECDITIADPNISRRHAEVRQEGTAFWIVDLGSTNGLEVNGESLERAKLESGDTITLGSTELVFERNLLDAVEKE